MKTINLFALTIIAVTATLILTSASISAQTRFKIRAREHFDTVWVSQTDISAKQKYKGIGPNLNFWWEDPYRFSIGFSYSLMFIDNDNGDFTGTGAKMELTKIGIESKYYFTPLEGGAFTRLGVSTNSLDTKGTLGNITGIGGYAGLGWEIKFSKIGLAFEAATRRIELDNSFQIDTFSPSIGVHFYGYI